MVKNPPANAGDTRDVASTPGLGRYPEVVYGNPLQYSCLGRIPWTEEPGRLQSMGSERVELSDRCALTGSSWPRRAEPPDGPAL